MKKVTGNTVLWIVVFFLSIQAKAQSGSLIYTSPDTSIYHTTTEWNTDYSQFYWDLTKDGEPDISFYFAWNRNSNRIDIDAAPMYETYSMGFPDKLWMIYDLDMPLDSEEACWIVNILGPNFGDGPGNDTSLYRNVAFRRELNNSYYYGWFLLKSDWIGAGMTFHIVESAFCTIPNYPLKWGQTSLNQGFEETESTACAIIHPNPTKGIVTLEGANLQQAEVLNTLGQRVAKVTGQGETLQIDIAELPAGVYFVTITDEEGRKCVKKVIKE